MYRVLKNRQVSAFYHILLHPIFILFADNTNLFCSIESIQLLEQTETVNEELELSIWFKANKLLPNNLTEQAVTTGWPS